MTTDTILYVVNQLLKGTNLEFNECSDASLVRLDSHDDFIYIRKANLKRLSTVLDVLATIEEEEELDA